MRIGGNLGRRLAAETAMSMQFGDATDEVDVLESDGGLNVNDNDDDVVVEGGNKDEDKSDVICDKGSCPFFNFLITFRFVIVYTAFRSIRCRKSNFLISLFLGDDGEDLCFNIWDLLEVYVKKFELDSKLLWLLIFCGRFADNWLRKLQTGSAIVGLKVLVLSMF